MTFPPPPVSLSASWVNFQVQERSVTRLLLEKLSTEVSEVPLGCGPSEIDRDSLGVQVCERPSGLPVCPAIPALRRQAVMPSTSPAQGSAMMGVSPAGRIRFTSMQMVPKYGEDCWQACDSFSGIEVLDSLQTAQELTMRPAHPAVVLRIANNVSPAGSMSSTSIRDMAQFHTVGRLEDNVSSSGHDGRHAPKPLFLCWGMPGGAMIDRAWRKGVAKAHGLSFLLERCEDHLFVYPARHLCEAVREWVAEVSEKGEAME
ncbi:hypothetical protein PG995_013378 [Apiospora arundinis]